VAGVFRARRTGYDNQCLQVSIVLYRAGWYLDMSLAR